jgi:transmembrane sensor
MRPEPAGDRPLDPHALEQAADWLVRLGGHDASDADHAACARWRAQDPEHARAWERAERLRGLLASVPAAIAGPVLGRPASPSRRAAMRSLAGAFALAPGGWLLWSLWERAHWDAQWRTATGERRPLRLDDGSQVELDTATALDAAFGPRQRLLRLREGQILIDTAPDPQRPARPFRVVSPHGRMQALGTRFNVRVDADRTVLAVLEGAVRVEPAGQPSTAIRVDAGQQLAFSASSASADVHALDPAATAWTGGMLAVDAWPLSAVLAELGRYRPGVLRCTPAVARLRVSGAFPLDDIDRSLAMLMATYPIAIEQRAGGWWTTVHARAAGS